LVVRFKTILDISGGQYSCGRRYKVRINPVKGQEPYLGQKLSRLDEDREVKRQGNIGKEETQHRAKVNVVKKRDESHDLREPNKRRKGNAGRRRPDHAGREKKIAKSHGTIKPARDSLAQKS